MSKKWGFLLGILGWMHVTWGSVIPLYEIATINGKVFILTNTAVFQATTETSVILSLWEPGDLLQLQSNHRVSPTPPPPYLVFENIEQNNQVVATLLQPPAAVDDGTFAILAIDQVQRLISLSNASVWRYYSGNAKDVQNWTPGDLVMIGKETKPSDYDAIMFNTDKQSVISVIEL